MRLCEAGAYQENRPTSGARLSWFRVDAKGQLRIVFCREGRERLIHVTGLVQAAPVGDVIGGAVRVRHQWIGAMREQSPAASIAASSLSGRQNRGDAGAWMDRVDQRRVGREQFAQALRHPEIVRFVTSRLSGASSAAISRWPKSAAGGAARRTDGRPVISAPCAMRSLATSMAPRVVQAALLRRVRHVGVDAQFQQQGHHVGATLPCGDQHGRCIVKAFRMLLRQRARRIAVEPHAGSLERGLACQRQRRCAMMNEQIGHGGMAVHQRFFTQRTPRVGVHAICVGAVQ